MRLELENVGVGPSQQRLAKSGQPGRIVELVPVHSDDPGGRAGVPLEPSVRTARVARALQLEMIELTGQLAQDLPGPVAGPVIERVDVVAEGGDVADRLLDEDVLVAD